jgi:hypothetical protein
MAAESGFIVPENLSFEAAIALAQDLVDCMAAGTIGEAALESAIAALVATENGARGFFVTYLSDSRPATDPTPALINALKTSPAIVASLMVKNLVMSTAMAITHQRNQNERAAQGSDQVKTRSAEIIDALRSPELTTEAAALIHSIDTNSGSYQAFLDRWGYDTEQKQAMRQSLTSLE